VSIADIYPDGRIPSDVRLLALERLHGTASIARAKGYTSRQIKVALLQIREWNPDKFFWQNEVLILWGVNKDRDIGGLEPKVPINIQTRQKQIKLRPKKPPTPKR